MYMLSSFTQTHPKGEAAQTVEPKMKSGGIRGVVYLLPWQKKVQYAARLSGGIGVLSKEIYRSCAGRGGIVGLHTWLVCMHAWLGWVGVG